MSNGFTCIAATNNNDNNNNKKVVEYKVFAGKLQIEIDGNGLKICDACRGGID